MLLFIVTSAGFGQVAGLEHYAGLLQRLTISVGWLWLTLLALFFRNRPPRHPPVQAVRPKGEGVRLLAVPYHSPCIP